MKFVAPKHPNAAGSVQTAKTVETKHKTIKMVEEVIFFRGFECLIIVKEKKPKINQNTNLENQSEFGCFLERKRK